MNINIDESVMMIKGFNICDGIIVVIYVLYVDVKNIKLNNLVIIYKFILLDFINFIVLVKELNEFVNLFVFKVIDGGRLIVNNVGVEIKLLFFIIEFINVVIKLNKIMIIIIVKFKFIV